MNPFSADQLRDLFEKRRLALQTALEVAVLNNDQQLTSADTIVSDAKKFLEFLDGDNG